MLGVSYRVVRYIKILVKFKLSIDKYCLRKECDGYGDKDFKARFFSIFN